MRRVESIYILTRRLIIMTCVAILLFSLVFGISYIFEARFMLTWAAFTLGIIGGFVSIQQRMNRIQDDELEMLSKSWFQIALIPVFGGVFSVLLYCVFLSDIITGDLFPDFYVPLAEKGVPDTQFMIELFSETYPDSGQSLAKFLFWSFVAGFSERLVPQIITRVTDSVQQ